jgi:hypothetical protein
LDDGMVVVGLLKRFDLETSRAPPKDIKDFLLQLSTLPPFVQENAIFILRNPGCLENSLWKTNLQLWYKRNKPEGYVNPGEATAKNMTIEKLVIQVIQQQFRDAFRQLHSAQLHPGPVQVQVLMSPLLYQDHSV